MQWWALYKLSLTEKEKRQRLFFAAAGELFTFMTLVRLIHLGDMTHIRMCVGSFFVVLVPLAAELVFSCKMTEPMLAASELYSVAPMLGECYKLYYTTQWWDKLVHTAGGVLFALFGIYIFRTICSEGERTKAAALFAFCFSVTVSAVWEFVEYASDQVTNGDMQNDTVIYEIHSYDLGDEPGTVGHITDIENVEIDGQKLSEGGYLDIGLHDTMQDMIVETIGAFAAALIYSLKKGRFILFTSLNSADSHSAV